MDQARPIVRRHHASENYPMDVFTLGMTDLALIVYGVAEQADAQDLKSCGGPPPCGFDSHSGHSCRVDSLVDSARGSARRGGRVAAEIGQALGRQIRRAGRAIAEVVNRLHQILADVRRRRKKRKREKGADRGW